MSKKFFKYRKLVIALLVVLVILVVLWSFYKEWDTIVVFPWKIQPLYILLSFSAYSAQLLLMFAAWHRMVHSMTGDANIDLDASVYFISAAARRIPTPVWYLGSRFTLYPPDSVPSSVILVCSVLEVSLLGLAGLLFLLISLLFYPALSFFNSWIIVLPGLVFLMVLLKTPNLIVQIINKILTCFHKNNIQVEINRRNLIEWLGIYLLVYGMNALSLHGTVNGIMEVSLDFGSMMAVATIYMIMAYISMFLTAGFGLKELVTGLFFTRWMPFSVGVVVTLFFRVMMTIVEILFVVIVKFFFPIRRSLPPRG